jgi:hypothetical protein
MALKGTGFPGFGNSLTSVPAFLSLVLSTALGNMGKILEMADMSELG